MKTWMNHILLRRAYRLLERLKPHLPAAGPILDVGSGTGHNALVIEHSTGLQVTEVDVTNMNALGRPVVLYDGLHLPFGGGTFRAAIMLFVLHYLPNPVSVLREIRRVCIGRILIIQSVYTKPSGRLVLQMREWLQGRAAFYLASWLRFVPTGPCTMQPLHYFTREELHALFRQAGLHIIASSASPWPGLEVSRDLYVLEAVVP